MNSNLFSTVPTLSSRVRFLKSTLATLNMPMAQKALNLMIEEMCAEKGFFRSGNGEHYYHHLVDVATILLNFGVRDEVTIVSAILHDAIEDVEWITSEYIRREYGQDVMETVSLVTKNPNINYKKDADAWFNDLSAILQNMRASLVKTADRVHNFSTLDGLPIEKQLAKSIETETWFFPFFKACREKYPEFAHFFFHAKTAIEPHLIKIKKSYDREQELLREIDALKKEVAELQQKADE